MTRLVIAVAAMGMCLMSACACFNSSRESVPAPEIYRDSIMHQGRARTFSYHKPEGPAADYPLIIALHKARSSGEDFREMIGYRLDRLADEKHFIMAYPDGFEGNWNDCRKAPRDSAHAQDIDDVGFISSLVDYFISRHSADKSQVFILGMSNGGQMCFRLMAEMPEKIAAAAPLLAQIPAPENSKCARVFGAMPVFLLSGTEDPISPYGGGEVSLFHIVRWGRVVSVEETEKTFLGIHGITGAARIGRLSPDDGQATLWVEKRSWEKQGRNVVESCIVHGGGHTLPGSRHQPGLLFGKTCDGINIIDEVVRFFLQDAD